LLRCQFPLAPAYATTFNSCQGLTLDIVGVDLTRPVFSHGQLYTALSRIRHHNDAKVRLHPRRNYNPKCYFSRDFDLIKLTLHVHIPDVFYKARIYINLESLTAEAKRGVPCIYIGTLHALKQFYVVVLRKYYV
jgi:hypothetical protein